MLGVVARAEPVAGGFLRKGEHWVMVGDSITNTGTFRELVVRVLQHFHPGVPLRVGNSAVNGVTADYQAEVSENPTLVSVMLGMNDVIHRHHPFQPDVRAYAERYRAAMAQKVREYKAAGADVILMTPTYTDERRTTFFENAMTRRILEAFGDVVREVAEQEGCYWLPVGEEFEAYQDTLGPDQFLRHDGVHPYGYGQYQIARTLWQHLDFPAPLSGGRRMGGTWTPAGAKVGLVSRFMNTPDDGVRLNVTGEHDGEAVLSWSLGAARGSDTLALEKGRPQTYSVPVPVEELTMAPGAMKWLIVDVADAAGRSLYVVDLACVNVLRPSEGVVEGTVETEEARGEGRLVCRWKIAEDGGAVWFSGDVIDGELADEEFWPFARDGVHLFLDLRPPARFGNPTIAADVSLTILSVFDQPEFTATLVPWINTQMGYAMLGGGERTDTGYRWRLGLENRFSTSRIVDIRKFDYYGFGLRVCDKDSRPAGQVRHFDAFPPRLPDPGVAIGALTIIDRKGVFPGDQTTKLAIFGP
jgi:lysophospholipase L1-like esterase